MRLAAVVALVVALPAAAVIVSRLAWPDGRAAPTAKADLPRRAAGKADRLAAAPAMPADRGRSPGVGPLAARDAVPPLDAPSRIAAARLMIPAPPGTDEGLQNVDPRILQALFQRGKGAMQHDADAETAAEGARLMNAAAALGYEPARALITVEYPTSAALQTIVPSADAVRYSLDPLLASGERSDGQRPFLVLLAAYFAGRQALPAYAGDVLAALQQDRRLQADDRVQALLGLIAQVHGACTALASAIVRTRSVSASECSPGLRMQIAHYVAADTAAGGEAAARRRALRLIAGRDGLQYSENENPPANSAPAGATSGAQSGDNEPAATSNTAPALRPPR